MTKDFAFLFKPGDYLRDTQCLSEKVQVAYDRIMCEHMRNICISQSQLNFFTKRLNEDEKNELLMVLTQINGGYEILWVAESIRERIAYSESRRINRAGKGKKSKKHMKNISKTYVKHMEGECDSEDNSIINIVFEKFWNLYDKKVGAKNKCEQKWSKLSDADRQKIIDTLPAFLSRIKDKQFQPYPETYLNQERWNDEITQEQYEDPVQKLMKYM